MSNFIDKILTEAVGYSWADEAVLNKIKPDLGMGDNLVFGDEDSESNECTVKIVKKDFNKVHNVITKMKLMGWYCASMIFNNNRMKVKAYNEDYLQSALVHPNVDDVELLFAKNYATKFEPQKKRYVYHVTPDIHLEKIKRIGLTPRSHAKKEAHPDRIYCSINRDKAIEIASMLARHETDKVKTYTLIAINLNAIKNVKWYTDPMFTGGVYTNQNIPPSALKILKTIPVSKGVDPMDYLELLMQALK